MSVRGGNSLGVIVGETAEHVDVGMETQVVDLNGEPAEMPEPEFNNPPWIPIADPFQVGMLGKLSEEMHELGKVVARTLMQGIEGKDPKSGDVNRIEMEKEIADFRAMLLIVEEEFKLLPLDGRVKDKVAQKLIWLNGLRPGKTLTYEKVVKRGGL